MSDPLFDDDDEANTPLEGEEREQLIPVYITLRSELNEAEQVNIADASRWAFARRRDILDEAILRELHRRMFSQVWKWAGQYRLTPRNIGIDAYRIGVEMRQLVDDVRYWVENDTYPNDETAVRFHHRLVSIHPFPNGNGRHARLAADLLVVQLGRPRFTWGSADLVEPKEARDRYVEALRAADAHDIAPLLTFARA
ncbi:MAG: mobile mystery protein B [Parvularcula sp.]|jgi:Fic-DOC domain mobile mystery protein B|nr:mobile mystery protein B [Parvularcula sp.]